MSDDADRKLRESSVPCIRRVTTVRLRMLPVRGTCPYGKNSPFGQSTLLPAGRSRGRKNCCRCADSSSKYLPGHVLVYQTSPAYIISVY